jgi:sugar fermentation stimulation protein A
LVKVKVEAGWVFIDTRLPNRILAKHWRELPPLCTYTEAHPERKWGGSRFDLALQGGESPDTAWLEAKCVTLVQDGIALFPDAPTERGQKHLLELTRIREEGSRSYVFFFLQHPGGKRIEAHREMDPQFAKAMVAAANVGVEFYGYRVLPGEDQVELTAVPVLIGDERN